MNSETMTYHDALRNDTWKPERALSDTIVTYIKKHKLKYKLDKLTRGKGNCFPIAVLQQLARSDIIASLESDIREIAQNLDHQELRRRVKHFVFTSNDDRLVNLKVNFDQSMTALADFGETTESW